MNPRLRVVCNYLLSCYGSHQAKQYDIHNTIVVAGCPRSGTTWLAEMLSTIPNSCIIMEPLNLGWVPESRMVGLSWRTQIGPDQDWPEVEDYVRRALTGRILNTATLSRAHPVQILRCRHWIVKFVRANRLLGWLTRRFPTRPPVLLIRHPCAVVASQLRVGSAWEAAAPGDLARLWCEDYSAPLSLPPPHPWIPVFYERLVRDGKAELERVFGGLGFELPRAATDRLKVPSSTTRAGSPVLTGEDPTSSWQSDLPGDVIEEVLQVVKESGLDFYSDKPEADYGRLGSWGLDAYRR